MNDEEKHLVEVLKPGHRLTVKEAHQLANIAMKHTFFARHTLALIPDETKGPEGRIMQLMEHIQICDGCNRIL